MVDQPMTLREFVETLPTIHPARQEFARLTEARAAATTGEPVAPLDLCVCGHSHRLHSPDPSMMPGCRATITPGRGMLDTGAQLCACRLSREDVLLSTVALTGMSAALENPDFAPVSSEAFDVACDVVERLTKHYPSPEWGRGRNGQVTLDWPSINLTVEVYSRATVHYAWTESEDAGTSGGGYWETATANIGGILSRRAHPAPQVAALTEEEEPETLKRIESEVAKEYSSYNFSARADIRWLLSERQAMRRRAESAEADWIGAETAFQRGREKVASLSAALEAAMHDTERITRFGDATRAYLESRGFVWDQILIATLNESGQLEWQGHHAIRGTSLRAAMDMAIAAALPAPSATGTATADSHPHVEG